MPAEIFASGIVVSYLTRFGFKKKIISLTQREKNGRVFLEKISGLTLELNFCFPHFEQ